MKRKARCGLAVAVLTLLSACNRSDTNMQEAYWCGSYGTCKPTAVQAVAVPVRAVDSASNCSFYGNCGQQRQPVYDACSFYGICDRGS